MSERRDETTRDDTLQRRLSALSPAQRALLERIMADRRADPEGSIPRRPEGLADVPASFEQERLWFMNELLSQRQIFNVPTALRLRGPLDVDALGRAVGRLVERHEALRTVFVLRDTTPRQVVLDRMDVPLVVHRFRDLPDPGQAARGHASASVAEPFDLLTGPLLRCVLYEIGEEDHLFLIVQHHIVSDTWSLGILLNELGACYSAEVGAAVTLAPLPAQYPDFAYWQRETLDESTLERQLGFWRAQLADLPGLLDLPTDRPRQPIRTSQGRFCHVEFPAHLVAAARRLAKEHSTTLNVAFLAVYFGLLGRLTRQEDLVVGVPIAGRSRPALQQMLGYFLNWLPIRVHLGGRPSLHELIRRTRDAFTGALVNQDLPFDMLVRELAPTRVPGVTPVFQTSFSLRDAAPRPPDLAGLAVDFADLDGGATHFDLMAELWCEDDRVVGYFPFDDALFDEATVESYVRWMIRLLEEGTADPDRSLCTVPLLTAAEHDELIGGGAVPEAVDATLHELFRRQAARRPDAVAVCDEHTRLSYADLDRRSDRLANVLLGNGVGPGSIVGLVVDRTVDLPTAVLAVLKCGAAYLPIDPDNPRDRTAVQFADCAVTAVLAGAGLADRLPDTPAPVIPLDWRAAGLADAAETAVAAAVPPSAPAYVIHTSGSTGSPKGVVVSHANVVRLFTAAEHVFDLREDDVWTLFHSYAFDFSVWELWGALLHGGRLVVVPQWMTRAPDAFLESLEREGVTVLSQTPSAFAQLTPVAAAKPVELSLRYVVFGGEALNFAALSEWFRTFGDRRPELVNMYGITETTVHVTFRRLTDEDTGRFASLIGRPLADLTLYLLDDELAPVPAGVPGEIFVGGAGVALGYQRAPALTAARMLPDPYSPIPGARMYRSGDIAVRRRDGELAYLGRADRQFKIRGHRVEIGETQSVLQRLPEVAQCTVFVADDRVGAKALMACVVPAEGHAPTPTRLRRALLRSLPDWLVPTTILVREELPLTRNGKIDQRALASLQRTEARQRGSVTPPDGETAEALAAIWEDMLGIRGIGAEDNFFELGGHSLMVVQLVSRIRAAFEVEVPMETLFTTSNLQAMADILGELDQDAHTGLDVGDQNWIAGLSEAELDAMLAALTDSAPSGGAGRPDAADGADGS
ncbi:non-ribosomal peptide synthetase [Sphaerimonospora sp. CA-214678]|uniref:non-ribosomal peptide synthetase n=1 Tax=Sphaerimonospora sp. CA-214678 TaxID=3240029 RepID=UPI003D8B24C4